MPGQGDGFGPHHPERVGISPPAVAKTAIRPTRGTGAAARRTSRGTGRSVTRPQPTGRLRDGGPVRAGRAQPPAPNRMPPAAPNHPRGRRAREGPVRRQPSGAVPRRRDQVADTPRAVEALPAERTGTCHSSLRVPHALPTTGNLLRERHSSPWIVTGCLATADSCAEAPAGQSISIKPAGATRACASLPGNE